MFETMLITFREGLEAFLIIAITLAYLNKTGRKHLSKAVYAGIGIALIICATTGYHIGELAEDPVMEGALALFAGILVASMTFYIIRTAPRIKDAITNRLEHHAAKDEWPALLGIGLFTVLMITREGMETALMLGTLSAGVNAGSMLLGATLGLGLTAGIGYLWVMESKQINIKLFLQVTGIFLILFSLQLFGYGLHELTETGLLPIDNFFWHNLTEPLEPHEPLGQFITYGLLAIPCTWLLTGILKRKYFPQTQAAE